MIKVDEEITGLNLRELVKVRARHFQFKLLVCAGAVAAAVALALWLPGPLWVLPALLLGLLYAHAVELQHQCLHNTAYRSKRWNRLVGVVLGLPSFVSFSDYQNSHLKHHRLLGTPADKEFFNYSYQRLTSLRALVPHLWMVQHYRGIAADIFNSLRGRLVRADEASPSMARRIRTEYQIMGLCLIVMAAATAVYATALFLKVWLIPFLVAVPTHALIELPEHMGCDRSLPNVLVNTRTMKANRLFVWFVNGNNYHVEHHWLPAVPNDKFPELHRHVASRSVYLDTSYWSFYVQFFRNLRVNNLNRPWEKEHPAAGGAAPSEEEPPKSFKATK
jgi:fatty acid desaturase